MADRSPIQAARLKSHRATQLGKRLRAKPTKTERLLWSVLRHLEVTDTHFRRQAPIGPYVVDIACHAAKLTVELDGGAHLAPDVAARDAERQAWLESRGYLVLRCTNAELEKDPSSIASRIIDLARVRTPTPGPAPQGGWESARPSKDWA
jgi:very-short-patch-repair endonuclease